MDLSYEDSSDDDNDMTVIRDDDPTDAAGSSHQMMIEENIVDENCNENDIEISDEESEPDLIMPTRKSKDPSPVWKCADRVEGGGAKCRFCPTINVFSQQIVHKPA